MTWFKSIKVHGIELFILSENFQEDAPSELVGFSIRHTETIEAIRRKDPNILEALNWILDEIDELSVVADYAHDLGSGGDALEYLREAYGVSGNYIQSPGGPFGNVEDYEKVLDTIMGSKFADEQTLATARRELDRIEGLQKQRTQAKAKKEAANRRRSQFAAQRDHLMLQLIERDGYECQTCKTVDDLTIDHIIPLSKGGSDELENLQLLCRRCNSLKNDQA